MCDIKVHSHEASTQVSRLLGYLLSELMPMFRKHHVQSIIDISREQKMSKANRRGERKKRN